MERAELTPNRYWGLVTVTNGLEKVSGDEFLRMKVARGK